MPRTKISEFSATAASNTDIDSINLAEGCAPSGINDAIRELMSQLKDFQTGAVGDSFNGPVGSTTAAAGAFTTLTASSTLGVTGVATLGAGAILNTPASVTLTNATGLPLTTGTTGTLATTKGGTNLTSFTSGGVVYASSSSALATGSALTFDGTNLATTGNIGLSNTKGINTSGTANYVYISGGTTGSASFGATLYLYGNTSAGTGALYLQSGNVAGGDIIFAPRDTEGMRLTSTGLGVGTSSPAYKLDVAGYIRGVVSNASVGNASSAQFVQNSTGDAAISFLIGATTEWLAGVDNSDSDSFKINNITGGGDFNNTGIMIATNGIITMPAYGAGAATFSASGVISSVSDETWKRKDGVPVNTDAMLQKLEPCYWFYNEEKAPIFGQERQLGFFAQNVNAAIGPEAAPEPEEGKPWGYYDRSVLAVTVMSLQKALLTIESLKARLDAANL